MWVGALNVWGAWTTPLVTMAILVSTVFGAVAGGSAYGLSRPSQQIEQDPLYLAIVAPASATLMLFTENARLSLIPVSKLVPPYCDGSAERGLPITVDGFDPRVYVFPNGTAVKGVLYYVNYYVGCSDMLRVESVEVRLEHQPAGPPLLYSSINVLMPLELQSDYYIETMLKARSALIAFEYVSETSFRVTIEVFNAHSPITVERIASKAWNITWEFLVDTNSWTALLKNNAAYVPVGVLPLATPANDVASLLYSLYANYRSQVEYYLEHPSGLEQVVSQIKSFLKTDERADARLELLKLVESSLPQLYWGALEVGYLGKRLNVTLDFIVGEPYQYSGFIKCSFLSWKVNWTLYDAIKGGIVEGILEYAGHGDRRKLEEVITKHPGLVYLGDSRRDYCLVDSQLLWTVAQPFPFVTGEVREFHLVLPATGLLSELGEYKYAHFLTNLEATEEGASSSGSSRSGMYIVENATWSQVKEMAAFANSRLVIAIDSRLASKWMTNTNASLNLDARRSILLSTASSIASRYLDALVSIAQGELPEKAFAGFLKHLENTIINAARSLGGEAGVERIMQMIKGGEGPQRATVVENEFSRGSTQDTLDRRVATLAMFSLAGVAAASVFALSYMVRRANPRHANN